MKLREYYNSLKECVFVNSALCHVVKNTQTAFSAILPAG